MKSWIRIISVFFVLIGSTAFFGYWSINQFNHAFDSLNASYIASTASISLFNKTNKEQFSATLPETVTTLATSSDLELSFTFPQKGDRVYMGCTYKISWQSSVINSLEITLIDAGSKKVVESVDSGLTRENIIEKDSQNLKWKVGVVWPGEYYIAVSKIDGISKETKSKTFTVNRMPKNIDTEKMVNICSESSGQL